MIYLIGIVIVSIVFGCDASQIQNSSGDCLTLMKAHFNQSEHDFFSKYIHFTRYKTEVPDLSSFTLSFWIQFDKLDQNSTVFTYVECQYGPTLISVKYVPLLFGWELKILDKLVILPTPVSSIGEGSWHHVLVSWNGKSSGLTFWLDGNHLDTHLYTKEEVIPGGGVVRSGQSEQSIAYWDTACNDFECKAKWDGACNTLETNTFTCSAKPEECIEKPIEGLNGWLTLLNFDSRPFAMGNSDDIKHRVSYLYSSCGSPGTRGNIIDWRSTPIKGYGSVTTHLANDKCGHF